MCGNAEYKPSYIEKIYIAIINTYIENIAAIGKKYNVSAKWE